MQDPINIHVGCNGEVKYMSNGRIRCPRCGKTNIDASRVRTVDDRFSPEFSERPDQPIHTEPQFASYD